VRFRWQRITCLALAMLYLPACFSGCTSSEGSWLADLSVQIRSLGQGQARNGYLSVHQLVQKIADAVRDDDEVIDAYDHIPDPQKDGITLDEFQQYIRFLRRGVSGSVHSFSQMTEKEKEQITEQVTGQLPEQESWMDSLCGFWIHYQEIGREEARFAIFVRDREDQYPDLNSTWVRHILDLQALAVLYFDAVDRYDVDALMVLLHDPSVSPEIIQVRAERLIQFYRYHVTSQSSEFKVTHARMDSIGFEEFGIINPDQTQAVSRTIEMKARADGTFVIEDVVPEVLHQEDLRVYYEDKLLFQLGQTEDDEPVQVQSGELESIIGAPFVHDDTVCTTIATGVQRMSLQYASLDLKAEGSCFRHSRWNGQVTFVRLRDSTCSLGSGLKPGDSEMDLLRHYPFAKEARYVIYGKTDGHIAELKFILDGEMIQTIELKLRDT
jgi:hypothetical protein